MCRNFMCMSLNWVKTDGKTSTSMMGKNLKKVFGIYLISPCIWGWVEERKRLVSLQQYIGF